MIETEQDVAADTQRPLPDGWRWVRLSEVGCFESGGTPSKDEPRYWGGTIPFVTGADITSFYVNGSQARAHVTEEGLLSQKTAVCEPGTVLFVTRTRVGRVGIAAEKMAASQDLSPYQCGARLAPEYVCWYLVSISDYLIANCRGSTILGLTRDFVESLEIPLPSLTEQRRIAAILRERMAAVGRARAAAEAQMEAARALPAAYLRAVFESDEARGWSQITISDLTATASGATPSRSNKGYYDGAIPWVKTGELRDGDIVDTEEHVTKAALRETSLALLPEQTLLIAMYGQGQTRGRTGLLSRPATTNQACLAVLPNARFAPRYLQYWFRHNYSNLRSASEGRGGNQPNLNGDIIRGQAVQLPALSRQSEVVASLDEQMVGAQQVLRTLQDQRDAIEALPAALLRQAFSGEL